MRPHPPTAAPAGGYGQAAVVAQRTEKKVLVPDEMVGKLIGKQGATIRTMQQLSNTHIEVQKVHSSAPSHARGRARACRLLGPC